MPTVVPMEKYDKPRDSGGRPACRTHRTHTKAGQRTQERRLYCWLNGREMAEGEGPTLGCRGVYGPSVWCRSCSSFQSAMHPDIPKLRRGIKAAKVTRSRSISYVYKDFPSLWLVCAQEKQCRVPGPNHPHLLNQVL